MDKFTTITSVAAPLPMINVDTDMIIPARFLKTIARKGLGGNLFDAMRFKPDGSENPDFVLNKPAYRQSQILVAGPNFGCGSSREHAPWALLDFGIRVIIAPSYADIFHANCYKNGILPITLPQEICEQLMDDAKKGANARLTIDLEAQTITRPDGSAVKFDIDSFRKHCLINGLDEIGLTEQKTKTIGAFEDKESRVATLALGASKMSSNKKLLFLPGDGIGPEVMRQVYRVIQWFDRKRIVRFDTSEALVGGCAYDAEGAPISDATMAEAQEADAVLFGAVGGPKWESLPFAMRPERGLLRLRKEMGLFANLRPALVFEPLVGASTLKPEIISGLDIMILRELTGGVYFGEPRGITTLPDGQRRGVNTQVYTTSEIVRVGRVAFELARKRRNKVCSVEKANVMESGELWREEMQKLHDAEYKDVELSHMYADNCAMQLVRNPKQFDVIVTDNLFGDILSDCAAMLTGSLGMLPSASLGEADSTGRRKALYEPVHGSAPDIAGKELANPLACVLSFAMMLRYSFDMTEQADMVDKAVQNALSRGVRTTDIMQPGTARVSTTVMGDTLLRELDKLA